MKKQTIITILFALVAMAVQAQEISKDSIYVVGVVADGFTKAAVPKAFVTLMRQDNPRAQGRTETWTNSMRRYALLTISYRFTQKPKKEK